MLDEVCGCHLSQGTLLRWVQEASERLATTVEKIADWLSAGSLQHGDETGMRIGGKLHWLHVNCTNWLTHLAWHRKRCMIAGSATTPMLGRTVCVGHTCFEMSLPGRTGTTDMGRRDG